MILTMIYFKNFTICYEEWSLWISAVGVFFSAVLSTFLICQTYKNHNDNKKNEKSLAKSAENTQKFIATEQAKLQNQAFQISLFDKRLPLYTTISEINHILASYIDCLEEDISSGSCTDTFCEKILKVLSGWAESFHKNGSLADLLFDIDIAKIIKRLTMLLVCANVGICESLKNENGQPIKKFNKELLLTNLKNFMQEFTTSDILVKSKLYLKVSYPK
jgi:hypothetical protein